MKTQPLNPPAPSESHSPKTAQVRYKAQGHKAEIQHQEVTHGNSSQISANRNNAKKSTGPKTPEGRAAARLNGLKYGLYAETLILPGEDPAEFDALLDRLDAEHQPATPTEVILVRQMAMASWRLVRLVHMEAGHYRVRRVNLIALETPVPYPEGAFTSGLLHDVGKLLIAVAMPEQFEALYKAYETGGESADDCEWSLLGVSPAEISGAIMKKWKLPEPIQQGVEFHHSPDEADRGKLHLAHVVEAADHYVNSFGLGMPFYRRHPVAAFDDCERKFGLKECTLKVAETFKTEFEAVRTSRLWGRLLTCAPIGNRRSRDPTALPHEADCPSAAG